MKKVLKVWMFLSLVMLGVLVAWAAMAWQLGVPWDTSILRIDDSSITIGGFDGFHAVFAVLSIALAMLIVATVVPLAISLGLACAALGITVGLVAAALGIAIPLSPFILLGWLIWRAMRPARPAPAVPPAPPAHDAPPPATIAA